MLRLIAIIMLLAHAGAVAGPALAKARTPDGGQTHCALTAGHAHVSVIQPAQDEDCDDCENLDCLGLVSCFNAGVAIVSMTTIDFAACTEIAAGVEGSSRAANPLHTPLSPPPKP